MLKPSYHTLMRQALEEREPTHPVFTFNDKMSARDLADLAGVAAPALLHDPVSLKNMVAPVCEAVVKPVSGCSARGVYALVPVPGQPEVYDDLMRRRRLSWDEVVQGALAAKHTVSNQRLLEIGHPDAVRPPWIAEEMVRRADGQLSYDWKAYCFGGRVEAVRQSDRVPGGPTRVKWWDRDWRPVGDIVVSSTSPGCRADESLPLPQDPDTVLEVSEAVAPFVEAPFVRVDVLEGRQGVVFGEVTPHPTGGRVRFVRSWDERFGRAWMDALGG